MSGRTRAKHSRPIARQVDFLRFRSLGFHPGPRRRIASIMSTKTAAEKHRHGYRRYRALARTLHARIYISAEGSAELVRGTPNFGLLMERLTRAYHVPAQQRTLRMLAGGTLAVESLTAVGMQARAHALGKWEQAINKERLHGQPARQRIRQLHAELAEISGLQRRLSELHLLYRQSAAGTIEHESGYWLTEEEERTLAAELARAERTWQLPPPARWLARFVMWLAGPTSLSRYLTCLGPAMQSQAELEQVRHIRALKQQLHVWKKRSASECHTHLRKELQQALGRLPDRLINDVMLSARPRGKPLEKHCELLLKRCDEALHKWSDDARRSVLVSMAALAACDGSRIPLPRPLVAECLAHPSGILAGRAANMLIYQSTQPGYDLLLLALSRLEKLPEPHQYDSIRIMMLSGNSLADIAWAQQSGWTNWFTSPLHKPGWLRGLFQDLLGWGVIEQESDAVDIIYALCGSKDMAIVDRWRQLVRRVQPATLTPRLCGMLRRMLRDLLTPALTDLSCHGAIRQWADPPRRRRQPMDGGNSIPADLRPWLASIAYYQRLLGQQPALPKSLRKRVAATEKNLAEAAFLQQQAAAGLANAAQRARLQNLEARDFQPAADSSASLLRAAEEACLTLGVEALRTIMAQGAQRQWHGIAGCWLPQAPLSRQLKFAAWARRMGPGCRAMLREVLAAWDQHGPSYKLHLAANQHWLSSAPEFGLNLDAWLAPPPRLTEVEKEPVRIAVLTDPLEVFLMGEHVSTCLSLDGCNAFSVLTNAYDANKQVLLMYDADGKVLARKLLTISQDFSLLGYTCYAANVNEESIAAERYRSAIADYCGRWAHRCGLPLGDTGTPRPIADHPWYDDGVCEWSKEAKIAWQAEQQRQSTHHALRDATTAWISTGSAGICLQT